jgi:hypothetical protein
VPDDQNAVEVADTLLTGQWVAWQLAQAAKDTGKKIKELLTDDLPQAVKDLYKWSYAKKAVNYLAPFFTEVIDVFDGLYDGTTATLNILNDILWLGVSGIQRLASLKK